MDFNILYKRITEDMKLFARWKNYYTVSFYTNEGATPTSNLVLENELVQKPSPNPTKDGYIFTYWEMRDKEGYTYEYDFNHPIYEDISLFAKWSKADNVVTVSYYTDDSYEAIHTQQVKIGSIISPFTAPDKAGKIFCGWRDRDSYTIWDFSSPIVKDIHFNAHYLNAGETTIVYFNSSQSEYNWVNNQEGSNQQNVKLGELLTEPTNPESYTHSFMGWYTHETAGRKWDFANDKVLDQNLLLHARWGNPGTDARLYKHIIDIEKIYNYNTENLYTIESWRAYNVAIENAKIEIMNNTLTDAQVEEGIIKLNQAVDNLVRKQIGNTERIEIAGNASFDGGKNLMLIGYNQNQANMSLARYTYEQMQQLGTNNQISVETYDANGNSTPTIAKAIGDNTMWSWIHGIESESGYDYGSTHISIHVKESGTTGKLTLIADNAKVIIPVKHYTYEQAKSYLFSEMNKLPAVKDADYRHIELIDNLENLTSALMQINYNDSEVSSAQQRIHKYQIYKVIIKRDGKDAAVIDGYIYSYKEAGQFPYGEYIEEWDFDSYNGIFSQYKSIFNADGTCQDFERKSATKDESAVWESDGDGNFSINPADNNTSEEYSIYVSYNPESDPIPSTKSNVAGKKTNSLLWKIVEKKRAEKQAARGR